MRWSRKSRLSSCDFNPKIKIVDSLTDKITLEIREPSKLRSRKTGDDWTLVMLYNLWKY